MLGLLGLLDSPFSFLERREGEKNDYPALAILALIVLTPGTYSLRPSYFGLIQIDFFDALTFKILHWVVKLITRNRQ